MHEVTQWSVLQCDAIMTSSVR